MLKTMGAEDGTDIENKGYFVPDNADQTMEADSGTDDSMDSLEVINPQASLPVTQMALRVLRANYVWGIAT